jgi:16S rRNA (cytidine1402-2'-O)-methyltransferase
MFNLPGYPATSVTIERPCLYLVATPIGNLGDITLRALRILEQVDVILAEDTRTSIKLLDRYGISKPLEALHQQNETLRAAQVVARINEGPSALALISDAGTPLVSDPGYLLARACHSHKIPVRYVPGASAVLGALVVSGLPCDRFAFEGFLPPRQAARCARLMDLKDEPRTLIYFEAPHRIRETLADMQEVLGAQRAVCVVRELTKLHETTYRGSVAEVLIAVAGDINASRGEIVIVVAPEEHATREAAVPTKLLKSLLTRVSQKDAVEAVNEATGYPRNLLYALALELKKAH